MPNWAYNQIKCKNADDFARVKELLLNDDQVDFNRIIRLPKILDQMPGVSQKDHLTAIASFLRGTDASIDTPTTCQRIQQLYPNVEFVSENRNAQKLETPRRGKGEKLYIDIALAEAIASLSTNDEVMKRDADTIEKAKTLPKNPLNSYQAFKSYEDYGRKALKCLIRYGVLDWYKFCTTYWGTKWNAYETAVDDVSLSIYFETAWSPVENLMRILSGRLHIPLYMEYAEEQFDVFAGELVFLDGEVINEHEYTTGDPGIFDVASRVMDEEQDYYRLDTDGEIKTMFDFEEAGNPEGFYELPVTNTTSDMYIEFMATDYDALVAEMREGE